jgi:protein-tyrosine-phosphatase
VLFVDSSGTVRARLAAALLEKMADWDGLGRAVAPSAAGLDVRPGPVPLATTAALLTQAGRLGLRARAFTAPPIPFEPADLDAADLIVGVDEEAVAGILAVAADGAPEPDAAIAEYGPRIASLSSFAACRGPRPLARSGSDVLDPALATLAATPPPGCASPAARAAAAAATPASTRRAGPFTTADARACAVAGGCPRLPDLARGGQAEWDAMAWHALRGVAGLAQYLGDALPPDMR